MEKVIIKTCVKKETARGTFYTIELSDGRKGSSFDDLTQKMGMEIELDIKNAKEFEGVMQYYFSLPKAPGQQGSKFPSKDWQYEKRKQSLICAIDAIKLTDTKVSTKNIISLSDEFFTYLNQK
jgi:hypothetical protein